MAYADEIAAANRLKDRDARFEARNAVRAKYGMEPEKRKRGGIAGLYDRNKAVVQAAVPTLAGMLIPGGAIAGAVAGGLARGLDRPGKSGIGLDLGQAAQGALTGAALGSAGKYLGGKMGIGPGAVPAPAAAAPAGTPAPTAGNMPGPAPGETMRTVGYGQDIGTAGAGTGVVTSGGTQQPGRMGKLLAGFRENAPLIQATATPLAAVIGGSMEQGVEARKLQLQEDQIRREQEARDRLAQLLMPMFQSQMGSVKPLNPPTFRG